MGLRILMQRCFQISEDCLLQHIQRAIYQAVIWKRATTPIIDAPSPTDHGWKIDEEVEEQMFFTSEAPRLLYLFLFESDHRSQAIFAGGGLFALLLSLFSCCLPCATCKFIFS